MSLEIAEFFLPKYYLSLYPDVANSEEYGLSDKAALRHYLECGYKEDRSPNPLFHPAWYLAKYEDIRESIGDKAIFALWHWLKHGMPEGRQGSALFSSKAYLEKSTDLQGAFGEDGYKMACSHWLEHGINEPRATVHSVNSELYSLKQEWMITIPSVSVLLPETIEVQEETLKRIGHYVSKEVSKLKENYANLPQYSLLEDFMHLAQEYNPLEWEARFDERLKKVYSPEPPVA